MYYLFISKKKDIDAYKAEFDRVKESIESGKTPVQNEVRLAKTYLMETLPYNILNGCFLVIGTMFINFLKLNELVSIATVLVVNSVMGVVSNWIFVVAKNHLRVRLCHRIGIEPTERNIAVMESLEYQSV